MKNKRIYTISPFQILLFWDVLVNCADTLLNVRSPFNFPSYILTFPSFLPSLS